MYLSRRKFVKITSYIFAHYQVIDSSSLRKVVKMNTFIYLVALLLVIIATSDPTWATLIPSLSRTSYFSSEYWLLAWQWQHHETSHLSKVSEFLSSSDHFTSSKSSLSNLTHTWQKIWLELSVTQCDFVIWSLLWSFTQNPHKKWIEFLYQSSCFI